MGDIIDIHIPEEKRISAAIDGKEYWFKVLFSLSDYEVVLDEVENENYSYRDILAKIVRKHACDEEGKTLSLDSFQDEFLLYYKDKVMEQSVSIRGVYEKHADVVDPFERFIISIKDNLSIEAEKIRGALNNIKIPQINIPRELLDVKPLLPDMSAVSGILASIAKVVLDKEPIYKSMLESFQPILERQQSFIAQIAEQAAKVLADLPSFSLSEEETEEIRESYRKWGEYGWTIPPYADDRDFWKKPIDIQNANAIASKYCTRKQMNSIIAEISQIKGVKKSDFKEAVDDYNDKRYKSCSFIMFSLIEAKLIRMQERQIKRHVGKGAVVKAKQIICKGSDIESRVFTYMHFENVYSCLLKLFENGSNFVHQPQVINRNFLDHGMLTRKVIKRDCDQLFLLYYNFLMVLDNTR